ncbi:MAG: Cys-tRNA(Pro)/Cys-tRNA(Cys) deacylase [Maribacter sp.]|jgi:Cys-tRNA(Pro)/Cys-tRNA(Cys) deacylase
MKKTNAIRILERKKIAYTTVKYHYDPANLNVGKIAAENSLELKSIFKTLVVKGDKNGVFVVVIPGDKELDMKAAAKISGNKKIHLLPIKDLEKTTGYIRGGCSPFGMKKDYPVFVDSAAQDLDVFYVNAGIRGILMGISPESLGNFSRMEFEEVAV